MSDDDKKDVQIVLPNPARLFVGGQCIGEVSRFEVSTGDPSTYVLVGFEAPSTQYGWMEMNSTEAFGPYDSREEALAQAKVSRNPGTEIILGIARPFSAGTYADLDTVVEAMEELALDEDYSWRDDPCDDPLFAIEDDDRALATTELRAWANRWFKKDTWRLDVTGETAFVLPEDDDDEEG